MSIKNDLAAKMAGSQENRNTTTVKSKVAPAVRDKPIRLSVDLEPTPYRKLVSWCADFAFNEGRAKINHVWVMRALVEELLKDKDLQQRVIERVREKELQ